MCHDYMSHFTKESQVYDLTFGNSAVVETVMIFLHSVLYVHLAYITLGVCSQPLLLGVHFRCSTSQVSSVGENELNTCQMYST